MDRQTFELLYEEHHWHLQRRCLRILGDSEEAHDVSQEVFIKLFHSSVLSGPTAVLPWLFRVATNACIDRLRLRKNHDPSPLDGLSTGIDSASANESKDLVLSLLRHFSSRDQMLAILRYVDECTLEEMEEICGMTRKTISKHLAAFRLRALALAQSLDSCTEANDALST